ncbi:tetratricopeptide repeat protein [Proteus mirabilis]|uniref:tetratricopeptide repeat protein n=1 Tax=Proteus mirabilis TaxID=584 RepID=UPI0034D5C500
MSKWNSILKLKLLMMILLSSGMSFGSSNNTIEFLLTEQENSSSDAIAELNLLAKQQDPHALSTLGFIYEHGINTPKDVLKAIDYYQQACELGGDYGCGNVWYFYQYGIGVEKNSKEAALFANKINKNNIPLEMANELSLAFYDAKAAAEANPDIRSDFIERLSRWLTTGDEETQLMFTRMGFSKQDTLHLAKAWVKEYPNDAKLNFQVGHLYNFRYSELDSERKDLEAVKWFKKAAELGEPNSQNIIAYLYEKGDWGIKQDPKKAIEWYQKAVGSGDNNAPMNLAKIYYKGVDTEVDYKKALSLFEITKDYNMSEYAKYLSQFYYNGQSVTSDCDKAADYYEKSNHRFNEEMPRSKYVALCQSDRKMRNEAKNELPNIIMKHISTFSGDKGALTQCELSFGIFSQKIIPVENLRVKIQMATENNSNDEHIILEHIVAFPPFGFNSLNKKENGGRGYENSKLVPVYDERGCKTHKAKIKILSATALINGKPIDLLEKNLILFSDEK